ncbi:MAG: hypothetical protein WCH61_04010 [bacterium]
MPERTEPAVIDQPVAPVRTGCRFKLGLFLLVANWPVGYGGAALALAWGRATGQDKFGAIMAAVFYAFSWGMLGAGVLLAGKAGLARTKELGTQLKNKFRRR